MFEYSEIYIENKLNKARVAYDPLDVEKMMSDSRLMNDIAGYEKYEAMGVIKGGIAPQHKTKALTLIVQNSERTLILNKINNQKSGVS